MSRARQRGGAEQVFSFYFANYTKWNERARAYLAAEHMKDVLLHMGAETHLRGGALLREQKKAQASGVVLHLGPCGPDGQGRGSWARRGLGPS